ncbi:hypothetical protein DFJ63DRAFT_211161 [Scheffersomyces coipomensis]|uniref:uncharacterized protein n=1 Tax=Scheffersomyces coipomensis TaxID=1788519 RepID=UPI00315D10F3
MSDLGKNSESKQESAQQPEEQQSHPVQDNHIEQDDAHSLSTLSSTESAHLEDDTHAPVPLDEATKREVADKQRHPKPSLLRRISTVASDYLGSSIASNDNTVGTILQEEANDYLDLIDRNYTTDDWFGQDQLRQSFSRRGYGDEEEHDEDLEEFPQTFGGIGGESGGEGSIRTGSVSSTGAPLQRRRSTVVSAIQAVTTKLGFWDKEFHAERIKIILTFANNYLFLLTGFTAALCIYWGSYYDRTARYKNIDFAIINADTQEGQLPAVVGPVVASFFNLTALQALGKFHPIDYATISASAISHNNTITEEVYRQIHHQKYWAAFYIKPNATLMWYEALATGSNEFLPSQLLEVVYETGRDYNAVNNYIVSVVHNILQAYYAYTPQTPLFADLISNLNSTQKLNVMTNAPQLLTTIPTFEEIDLIPVPNQIVQAPLQIGLIYLVIFSFFQFILQLPIHMYIASKIKGFKYVAYRMISSQMGYVILALGYVSLNAAYGLSYSTTFGRSGFLVVWAFAYLTMGSLGSIIEVLVLLLFAVKPQLIGFLLLFVAVINVSPTVSPIMLCPDFYRYGYGIPVRNSYDLMHVAYFNAWKGNMGRNIGILLAWMVCSNLAMPFLMKWMAAKKAKADAAAAAAAAAEKARLEEEAEVNSVTEHKQ